jgi:tRNA A22 N-methylase
MARRSALQKIEEHEKLCRIMQKQTFEQIKEMKERIKRIEYMIIAGMGSLVLALIMNYMK